MHGRIDCRCFCALHKKEEGGGGRAGARDHPCAKNGALPWMKNHIEGSDCLGMWYSDNSPNEQQAYALPNGHPAKKRTFNV